MIFKGSYFIFLCHEICTLVNYEYTYRRWVPDRLVLILQHFARILSKIFAPLYFVMHLYTFFFLLTKYLYMS